ncbi:MULTISPECIES: hypothetical protein [unclassified Streptomyces]|nr:MULTISPECIES: hypothetical protein [unclassified Streptomyces]
MDCGRGLYVEESEVEPELEPEVEPALELEPEFELDELLPL